MTLPFLPFQPFQRLQKPVSGAAPTFGERCRSNRCLRKASTAGWNGSAHRLFAGFRRLSRKRSNDGSFHRLSTDRSNTWNRRQFSQAFESFPETPETVPAFGTGFDRLFRWLERQLSQAFAGFPESVLSSDRSNTWNRRQFSQAFESFPETPDTVPAFGTGFDRLSKWLERQRSQAFTGFPESVPAAGTAAFIGIHRLSRDRSNDWNDSVHRLSRDGPNGCSRSFHMLSPAF